MGDIYTLTIRAPAVAQCATRLYLRLLVDLVAIANVITEEI